MTEHVYPPDEPTPRRTETFESDAVVTSPEGQFAHAPEPVVERGTVVTNADRYAADAHHAVVQSRSTETVHHVRRGVIPDYTYYAVAKTIQIIWYLLGLVEMLLGLRFLLRLIGASEVSPFTTFMYRLTYPLIWPFIGVTGAPGVAGGPVFETFTVIAMLVYLIFAIALVWMLRLIITEPIVD